MTYMKVDNGTLTNLSLFFADGKEEENVACKDQMHVTDTISSIKLVPNQANGVLEA